MTDVADRASARQDDGKLIQDFRQLVRNRLGELGLAVLDARLDDEETQSLVGREELGSPNRYALKKTVRDLKPSQGSMLAPLAIRSSCETSNGRWGGKRKRSPNGGRRGKHGEDVVELKRARENVRKLLTP